MATETVQMKVSGLMCSFCTMSLETAVKRNPGVKSVMVNLVHGIVLVEADTAQTSREQLADTIEKMGYSVSATEVQQYAADEALFGLIKKRSAIGMTLAIIDVFVDPLNAFGLPPHIRAWFSFAVAAFILLWVGFPILRKTILALRGRVINANVLLSAAAWGSFIVGTLALFDPRWPNFLPVAGWLMALHLFFGYFKLDTRKKASEAVRKLLSLQPARARVLRGDQAIDVATSDVAVGEIVLVRPGERIPLDGQLIDGTASVDESSFTGEALPATRTVGQDVIGGSVNLDGALKVRVSKIGAETFISQIVHLMTQISERKPPIELLADKLMNYYGPVVFIVAALAFTGWLLVTGNIVASVLALVTTIIMGYPCALGITTPMLAAIAGGRGIAIGLLVKASEVFHGLSEVNTVVLDKTGTLTYGKPTVTDAVPFGIGRDELLALAGSLEAESEHPVGQSIMRFAEREKASRVSVVEFRAIPGRGIEGRIDDSKVVAGKPSFVKGLEVEFSDEVDRTLADLSSQAKTVVVVAREGDVIGVIALQDTPRKGARELIDTLTRRGIKTVMLTGDARPVGEAIARQLGIGEVRAELLPADKVSVIQELQARGAKVAMVGDGINDAPALAQADVGIAIGAGTDVAIESAGVILVGDRLQDVANALDLGRASYRTLTGNVIVAVIFNILGMTLAALGLVTPLLAITFMIVSIFAILLNTLRIRWMKLESAATSIERGDVAHAEFRVPEMVCEACAGKITDLFKPMPGVRSVKPHVAQKKVAISYDPATLSSEQLKAAFGQLGYTGIEV